MDIVLARHFLPLAESGYYSAAATAARAILFLPGAVALLAFPRFVGDLGPGSAARRAITDATLAVFVLTAVGCAIVAVAAPMVVEVIFGDGYAAAARPLRILAISSFGMAMTSLFMHFALARGSAKRISCGWESLRWLGGSCCRTTVSARSPSAPRSSVSEWHPFSAS